MHNLNSVQSLIVWQCFESAQTKFLLIIIWIVCQTQFIRNLISPNGNERNWRIWKSMQCYTHVKYGCCRHTKCIHYSHKTKPFLYVANSNVFCRFCRSSYESVRYMQRLLHSKIENLWKIGVGKFPKGTNDQIALYHE